MCSNGYESLPFSVAFCCKFLCVFGISEHLLRNKFTSSGLALKNIHIHANYVLFFISGSKSDQEGRGYWLCKRKMGASGICPISIVARYWAVRPMGGFHLLVFFPRDSVSV